MQRLEPRDFFESPGEALLFLSVVPPLVLSFVGYVLWVMGTVTTRSLIPLTVFVQIGLFMQYVVERRIARRLQPQSGWREAHRSKRTLRKALWRLETFRAAADIVGRDVPGAVRAVHSDRILSLPWVGLCVLSLGANIALSLALS